MSFRVLDDQRATEVAELEKLQFSFYEAHIDSDVEFNQSEQMLVIPFWRGRRWLDSTNVTLPAVQDFQVEPGGATGLVPFVKCRLVIRKVVSFSMEEEFEDWFMLGAPEFDESRKLLVIRQPQVFPTKLVADLKAHVASCEPPAHSRVLILGVISRPKR
jgi:hypothetical protein